MWLPPPPPTPPIKLKPGQQIGGGTTHSKPPRPIIMMGQSETRSSSQIIFMTLFSNPIYDTLFCRCTVVLGALPAANANCALMLSYKTNFLS